MEECRPMTQRAFKELIDFATKRLEVLPIANEMNVEGLGEILSSQAKGRGVDLLIDGLLGIQARPTLKSPLGEWIKLLNDSESISVRVSIDLPTGITESSAQETEPFRADFTYCTGIVKLPVIKNFNQQWVGRLRYLDLDFFGQFRPNHFSGNEKILRPSALTQLRKLR